MSKSGPHFHSVPNAPQKIIVNIYSNRLTFDRQTVDFFFQKLESLHRHENVTDAELFDQLSQCVHYTQQSRMQHFLANETGNYFYFKRALIETDGRTLDQAQKDLECAAALGDKMPYELSADIRNILERHRQEIPLLEDTLRREFLQLPVYARYPLTSCTTHILTMWRCKQTL